MPILQIHMYRVAAVARTIAKNSNLELNANDITAAALLHDMGNIIKFKLGFIPEAIEPEGLEYWQKVQNEFKERYGNDENEATYQIVKELNTSDRILELIKSVGMAKAVKNSKDTDFAKKICCYSDHRVGPDGIKDLKTKIKEGKARSIANHKGHIDDTDFENMARHIFLLEEQIFSTTKIRPEDITNESMQKTIEELEDFEIPTK